MAAASRRSSSNGNESGSAEDRRRRKMWLLDTFRADTDAWVFRSFRPPIVVEPGTWPSETLLSPYVLEKDVKACRCYRCGRLLIFCTLTVDRIIPGKKGGTYRRNNIRPACGPCNFGHNRKDPS